MPKKKYFFILGEAVLKRSVYLGIAIALLVVCGGLGGIYYMLRQASGDVGKETDMKTVTAWPKVAEATETDAQATLQEEKQFSAPANTLEQVLERHLEVTGYGACSSFILKGIAENQDTKVAANLMAIRPNLYKLKTKYELNGKEVQFGYDGQQGWLKHEWLKEVNLGNIDFFMQVALFESSLMHLAWTYQSELALKLGINKFLQRLPQERWQGRTCEVIMSRGLLPITMYHYLDAETYAEVYRKAEIVDGTKSILVEMKYSGTKKIGDSLAGIHCQLYFDGELHEALDWAKVRLNPVMLSALLAVPVDVSITGLAL